MSKGIRLSPKHGLNPSIAICFFCQKDKNEIVLPGRMKGDAGAPKRACWNKEPCSECKALMTQGVIFISVDAAKSDNPNNPYRTGAWCVLKEEAVTRMLQPGDLLSNILRQRVCFIPDEVWQALGLPR